MATTKKTNTDNDPTGRRRFYDEPGSFTTTNSKAFNAKKARLEKRFLTEYNSGKKSTKK